MPRVQSHFRSLPYTEVADALALVDLSGASQSTKLCLRFVILTAARSGEARNATWDEINFGACEWKIPAERMKAASEHRVPLSNAALDVLDRAKDCHDGSDLVFPSPLKPGRPLSDATLTKILRDVGVADRATVHGFRASFRTWALEETDTPWAVAEAALAHSLGDSVQQAYIRGDAYTKRRKLMDQKTGSGQYQSGVDEPMSEGANCRSATTSAVASTDSGRNPGGDGNPSSRSRRTKVYAALRRVSNAKASSMASTDKPL